jgi:hypothetical protein
MSDATDDSTIRGRRLLERAEDRSLRERMAQFRDERRSRESLPELREQVTTGADLSEIVTEGRDERV